MKKSATNLLIVAGVLLLPACSRYSDVRSFNRNDALVTANGTVIVKGFGDENAASVVCLAPGSPYAVDITEKTGAQVASTIPQVPIEARMNNEYGLSTKLAYEQTERIQALREVMVQMCFAYGNGVFGKVGDAVTFKHYQDTLNSIVNGYLKLSDQRLKVEQESAPLAPSNKIGQAPEKSPAPTPVVADGQASATPTDQGAATPAKQAPAAHHGQATPQGERTKTKKKSDDER